MEPDRVAVVDTLWSAPRTESTDQAVRTLLEEAGVRGVSAPRSTSTSPVATSMTLTPTLPVPTRESAARASAYLVRTPSEGTGASGDRPAACALTRVPAAGVGKGWIG